MNRSIISSVIFTLAGLALTWLLETHTDWHRLIYVLVAFIFSSLAGISIEKTLPKTTKALLITLIVSVVLMMVAVFFMNIIPHYTRSIIPVASVVCLGVLFMNTRQSWVTDKVNSLPDYTLSEALSISPLDRVRMNRRHAIAEEEQAEAKEIIES